MLIHVLDLMVLLTAAFAIGYCGAKPHGFHKLGQFFGIVCNNKEGKNTC